MRSYGREVCQDKKATAIPHLLIIRIMPGTVRLLYLY